MEKETEVQREVTAPVAEQGLDLRTPDSLARAPISTLLLAFSPHGSLPTGGLTPAEGATALTQVASLAMGRRLPHYHCTLCSGLTTVQSPSRPPARLTAVQPPLLPLLRCLPRPSPYCVWCMPSLRASLLCASPMVQTHINPCSTTPTFCSLVHLSAPEPKINFKDSHVNFSLALCTA